MAQWQRELDLREIWRLGIEHPDQLDAVAKGIAVQIRALKKFGDEYYDYESEDIAWEFDSLSTSDEVTTEEFDDLMERLYDWADQSLDGKVGGKKVCWVKTT